MVFQVVVATPEDLSIDVSFNNVGLIMMKLRWFFFGVRTVTDRRTLGQRHCFGIVIWKNLSKQKNFNSKLKIRSYLPIAICIPRWRGCIRILNCHHTELIPLRTRMRAVQHKCLPHLACIIWMPLAIIFKNCNHFEKWFGNLKKAFHKFVELV